MAIVTEVEFAHRNGALVDTLTEHPEIRASVVGDARTDPHGCVHLIRFEGTDLDVVRDVLERDRSVASVHSMPGFEAQHILGVEFAPEAKLMNPSVTSRNGLVLQARSSHATAEPRGWRERWLLPAGDDLQELWHHARGEGFEFEIADLQQQGENGSSFASPAGLTPEQRDGLIAAYDHGYFTEPRETTLEVLADELDLSTTAVAGRIKRGMKSLIWETLIKNEDVR